MCYKRCCPTKFGYYFIKLQNITNKVFVINIYISMKVSSGDLNHLNNLTSKAPSFSLHS